MDTITYETIFLEKLRLGVSQALSKQLLHGIRVDDVKTMTDFLRDQIVVQLRAHVLADPQRDYRKTHSISYDEPHPSWKHHLTASLPKDSFLRRWCHFFWEIPFDYATTRITETIEVHVPTIFPENTMQYPPELGSPHHPIQIMSMGTTKEPYYG